MSTLGDYLIRNLELKVVERPIDAVVERSVNRHPMGVIVALIDEIERAGDKAISIKGEALTQSNVAVLYQTAHKRKIRIHILSKEDRKIIWVNREEQISSTA